MNGRSWVGAPLLAIAFSCAPLIDFDSLTKGSDAGDAGDAIDASNALDASDAGNASDAGGANDSGDAGEVGNTSDAPFDAGNPCANVTTANDGFYCGQSTENGFAGGDSKTLYQCSGGGTVGEHVCVDDCVIAPQGYSDVCDECSTKGNGAWCGKEFQWPPYMLQPYVQNLANLKFICSNGKSQQTPIPCLAATPTCHPMDGGAVCGT
jgi:hypothetical protein